MNRAIFDISNDFVLISNPFCEGCGMVPNMKFQATIIPAKLRNGSVQFQITSAVLGEILTALVQAGILKSSRPLPTSVHWHRDYLLCPLCELVIHGTGGAAS